MSKYSTSGGIPVCGSPEHGCGGEGLDQQGLERWEGEEARQQREENEVLEEDAVKNDEVFESDAENDDEKYFCGSREAF